MANFVFTGPATGENPMKHRKPATSDQFKYAITDIPNTAECHAAADRLRFKGYHHRRRGRGHRYGIGRYHQELPIALAERFTLYGVKVTPSTYTYHNWRTGKDEIRRTYDNPWNIEYARYQFIALEPDGRLRIRTVQQ